ncbi:hypothetical protein Pelo_16827 [Pelomyxa schiedti]|nr:hypothetical protein Pelo_16827 [Pelomyxa schiedti]
MRPFLYTTNTLDDTTFFVATRNFYNILGEDISTLEPWNPKFDVNEMRPFLYTTNTLDDTTFFVATRNFYNILGEDISTLEPWYEFFSSANLLRDHLQDLHLSNIPKHSSTVAARITTDRHNQPQGGMSGVRRSFGIPVPGWQGRRGGYLGWGRTPAWPGLAGRGVAQVRGGSSSSSSAATAASAAAQLGSRGGGGGTCSVVGRGRGGPQQRDTGASTAGRGRGGPGVVPPVVRVRVQGGGGAGAGAGAVQGRGSGRGRGRGSGNGTGAQESPAVEPVAMVAVAAKEEPPKPLVLPATALLLIGASEGDKPQAIMNCIPKE